eukprot:scaffold52155_cov57-Phaeocystis_antarctica.AAC.2
MPYILSHNNTQPPRHLGSGGLSLQAVARPAGRPLPPLAAAVVGGRRAQVAGCGIWTVAIDS